ncbi:hypothetical protein CCACVL1_12873 [Corchorus capsularis]|uniref:Uncharacterized protein n=1 Tax=Corchorus capsularis TaxID=210143 RepID=A0A1R3IDE0_COCAP|nr:hypothetical protein CCACVL1_12873 [Corchorus capsularis]
MAPVRSMLTEVEVAVGHPLRTLR